MSLERRCHLNAHRFRVILMLHSCLADVFAQVVLEALSIRPAPHARSPQAGAPS